MRIKAFLFISLLCTATVQAQQAWQNPALSAEERAADLLPRLTLEEKATLMMDVSKPIERLGIRGYNWWNEALHGVARNGLATVFPQAIGMAASFNDDAVLSVFDAVSDEARAKYNEARRSGNIKRYQGLTFWTPNVNIFRDPRWGRGQETYGEDPYLSSRMGLAAVRGLQGYQEDSRYDKLHACAKHFAVHSGPEWNRHSFNAKDIAPRDLWETYLPAFKTLVQEGDVREVMCAYNRFEGDPCCGSNRLLMQILRQEWGYKWLVVSDCGAVRDFTGPGRHNTSPTPEHASATAVAAGTDVECGSFYNNIPKAVSEGLVSEAHVDSCVMRLLTARFRLGEMDSNDLTPWAGLSADVVNSPAHRQLSLDMARQSMVLLKNNGILPLNAKHYMLNSKMAVIGPNAADSIMLWGNYNGTATHSVTILDGIRQKVGNVHYIQGCNAVDGPVFESLFNLMKTTDGLQGVEGTYWNNTELSGNVAARQRITTPLSFDNGGATVFAPGVALTQFSARYTSIFTAQEDGDVTIWVEADDGARVIIDGQTVIDDWGHHKARRKEYTFTAHKNTNYDITVEYRQGDGEAVLRMDIGRYQEVNIQRTLRDLTDYDTVIFVGGISARLEGEEMRVDYPGFKKGDRTSIELPQVQRNLIKALHDAGKHVILVNCSGSAMGLVPEVEACDAILQAWYPGEQGGTAVADVLFGDYNPAGRLPITFYKNVEQLPDFEDYSMRGRTYRYFTGEPLFPFGYGLSYTSFKYSKVKVKNHTQKGGGATLAVDIANTGENDGDEVVQVYIKRTEDTEGPQKSLRAFRRIHLKAGQKQTVEIDLPQSAFETFDTATNTVRVVSGNYLIMVGGNSQSAVGNQSVMRIK